MKPTILLMLAATAGYCQTLPDARTSIAYRAGEGVILPILLDGKAPLYSDDGLKAKCEGIVKLSLVVGLDGRPESIKVTQKLGLRLDEATVEAVRQWRFKPAITNGSPVLVAAEIEANYRLRNYRATRLQYATPQDATAPVPTLRFYPFAGESCGLTTVRLYIGLDGLPSDVRVVRTTRDSMSESLIGSVKSWRFQAARQNGRAIDVDAEMDLDCEPWPAPR